MAREGLRVIQEGRCLSTERRDVTRAALDVSSVVSHVCDGGWRVRRQRRVLRAWERSRLPGEKELLSGVSGVLAEAPGLHREGLVMNARGTERRSHGQSVGHAAWGVSVEGRRVPREVKRLPRGVHSRQGRARCVPREVQCVGVAAVCVRARGPSLPT